MTETLRVIHKRASLKSCISDRKVAKEDIVQILEAARAAPSGRNNQPTRFVVVDDAGTIGRLLKEAFAPGNTPATPPLLIFVCANPKDSVERDGQSYYLFDAGLAMENLLLAATDLGLVTHPMTGFKESEARKILGVPNEVKMAAVTPISCPAQGSYDEAAKARLSSRSRKSLKEIVFWNKWGSTTG